MNFKKINFITLILSFSIFTVSCVSLNTVSLTSIPEKRNKQVRAEVERFMVLGFNFDNDYIDPLVDKLKSQCPNGLISGVLTKDENIDYFIYIFWKKRIQATGFCVENHKG